MDVEMDDNLSIYSGTTNEDMDIHLLTSGRQVVMNPLMHQAFSCQTRISLLLGDIFNNY